MSAPCRSWPDRSLVEIRGGGAKTPLFCVHAAAGHLRLYENLARHLQPERPVYGLRAVAHAHQGRFRDMAERYVGEILELQPAGSHIIVGECDGGALAYEVAQQLRAACASAPLLVLVDSFGPGRPRLRPFVPRIAYSMLDEARLIRFHVQALAALDWRARRTYLAPRIGRVRARIRRRIVRGRAAGLPAPPNPQAFRDALGNYVALPYDGRAVLLYGGKLPWGVEPEYGLGWGSLIAHLGVYELPAYFGTNLLEPDVAVLAGELERALDAG